MTKSHTPQDPQHPLQVVLDRRHRKEVISQAKLDAFLVAYAKRGNMLEACRVAEVSYSALGDYRRRNPEFEDEVMEAKEIFKEMVDRHVDRRAGLYEPFTKTVYYKGEPVGEEFLLSDRALELMAKRTSPEKYNDKMQISAQVTGGVMVVTGEAQSTQDWLASHNHPSVPASAEQEQLPASTTSDTDPDPDPAPEAIDAEYTDTD